MSKSKVVLVVDVTSATLDEAISVMCQDILQRMYNTPENSIALVLAGTVSTVMLSSQLNNTRGGVKTSCYFNAIAYIRIYIIG